jgi:hypothetical protein
LIAGAGWRADFEGNQFTARQLGDYVEALISGNSAKRSTADIMSPALCCCASFPRSSVQICCCFRALPQQRAGRQTEAPAAGCSSTSGGGVRHYLSPRKRGFGREAHVRDLRLRVGVIDFDNDGLPDLFFANGADLATASHRPATRSIAIWETENSRM